jgi:hypothetical protein
MAIPSGFRYPYPYTTCPVIGSIVHVLPEPRFSLLMKNNRSEHESAQRGEEAAYLRQLG